MIVLREPPRRPRGRHARLGLARFRPPKQPAQFLQRSLFLATVPSLNGTARRLDLTPLHATSTQRARIQAPWRRRLATPWRRRETRSKRSGASESETYQQLRFCRLSATWRPAAIDSCTGNHVPNARLDGIGGWLSSRVFTEPLLGSPSRTPRPRPVPRPAPEGFPAEASPRPSLPTAGSSRSRGVSAGRRAACLAWTEQREEPRWERDETQRALQVASACGSSDWLPAAPPSFSPSDSIA